MPAYDTVPAEESRIPEWIQDTVYTRNTVNIAPHCVDYIRSVQGRLVQYKNAPEAYIQGTLYQSTKDIVMMIAHNIQHSMLGCKLLYDVHFLPCIVCLHCFWNALISPQA